MSRLICRLGISIFFIILLTSCHDQTVSDQVISTNTDGWKYSDKISFEYAISDTLASYDILIHVRNTKNYPYSNLWLFIETLSPAGNYQKDTIEITLADETGKWLGKGSQSINTMLVPYKNDVHFSERGIYKTQIQHAMRDSILTDITDIGLRVQFHQPK